MANPKRILFVSGEVEPFASVSETAQLVRALPEQLLETGDFDTRIMMPRYGTISERRNRLHEVIRLSGTEVPMGNETETLKVKVASIPGIRLQVYFMDNVRYFKRKGVHADKSGVVFDDNTERALFFGRAVLETLRKLMWGPDVIHAFGWISSFIPMLLATEYADEPLFAETKVVFTPDDVEANATLSSEQVETLNLNVNGEATGQDLPSIGLQFADLAIYPPSLAPATDELQFSEEQTEQTEQVIALYEQAGSDVLA